MPFLAFLVAMWLVGCGTSSYEDGAPTNDAEFAKVKPIVDANCGVCHNGSTHPLKLDSGAKLKAAKGRIVNGTMPPPPRSLKDADKQALLGYING